ncbi:MurR/RpiR family transcriptional regulator [Microbacterium sp. 179-I 3D2 NHS]|uniref:MurR/RpiR family transcriptional regulator n=1 Tax=Microbacterium sp. 179-I 3D2 NHS TaxID=3235178 RepID=UPI00399EFE42
MPTAADPSALQLLRDLLPSLTGAKLRVAEIILADPLEAGRTSITSLAVRADTQAATITRLSAALGYSGFPALRAAIANEAGRELQDEWLNDIGPEITPGDSPEHVLTLLARHDFRALRNALANIDVHLMATAAERIASADRVEIFGEWGDHPPAEELFLRLKRLGVPVWLQEGSYASRVGAGLLTKRSVALAVSRNGMGAIPHAFLAVAAERGATTIAITGAAESLVAEQADIVLYTGTGGGTTWIEYFAGRAGDDFLASALWVLVAQRLDASFTLPDDASVN